MSDAETRILRGEALRRARNAAHLTARELAERVTDRTEGKPLNVQALYSYEAGRVMLSSRVARRVADVLNVAVATLLVGDPDFAGISFAPAGSEAVEPDATEEMTLVDIVALTAVSEMAQQASFLRAEASALRRVFPPRSNPAQELPVFFHPRIHGLCEQMRLFEQSALHALIVKHAEVFNTLSPQLRRIATARIRLESAWQTIAAHFDHGVARLTDGQREEGCRLVADALDTLQHDLLDFLDTAKATKPERILRMFEAQIARHTTGNDIHVFSSDPAAAKPSPKPSSRPNDAGTTGST